MEPTVSVTSNCMTVAPPRVEHRTWYRKTRTAGFFAGSVPSEPGEWAMTCPAGSRQNHHRQSSSVAHDQAALPSRSGEFVVSTFSWPEHRPRFHRATTLLDQGSAECGCHLADRGSLEERWRSTDSAPHLPPPNPAAQTTRPSLMIARLTPAS